MTKPEFNVGDRVAWKYGVGKGTGHIVERVTKVTKLYGKNFKATPEEPKYRIKSDKGKELIRNPETLEMLKEDAGVANEGGDKEDGADEKDEEIEDVEGNENEDEIKEALITKSREIEERAEEAQNGSAEDSKEREVGGEPLQQMPGAQIKIDMISGKSIPFLENVDENASLSKTEAHYEPGKEAYHNNGSDRDVEMEEVKEQPNGSTTRDAPHRLPHEEVPQPDLDAVK